MRAEAWRGDSFSEMRCEMTKTWLKGCSIINWAGRFNGDFDVWKKREKELKMPPKNMSLCEGHHHWQCRKEAENALIPQRRTVQRLKF